MHKLVKKFLGIERAQNSLARIIRRELDFLKKDIASQSLKNFSKLEKDYALLKEELLVIGKQNLTESKSRFEKLEQKQDELKELQRTVQLLCSAIPIIQEQMNQTLELVNNPNFNVQDKFNAEDQRNNKNVNFVQEVRRNFLDIQLSLGNISQRILSGEDKKRIVFLIHNVATIDALLPVIYEAQRRKHIVLPIAIRNTFDFREDSLEEEKQHYGLSKLGIEHLRFEKLKPGEGLKYLKKIRPDVIFRQSPWDNDIDEDYRTHNLAFSRICYTPYYGVQLLKNFNNNDACDFHCDQEFHRSAWAIFVENTSDVEENFRQNSLFKGVNVVRTGLPKYEHLAYNIRESSTQDNTTKNILWAPHHSFSDDWLGFANFIETYPTLLRFLENNKNSFTLTFRPHPLFKKNLIASGKMTEEMYQSVLEGFNCLPNFSISTDSSSLKDFEQSDLLVTDGISFLASYLLTGKPIIWLDSNRHTEFASFGKKVVSASYHLDIKEINRLPQLIMDIGMNEKDPLVEQRELIKNILVGSSAPSKNILDYIEKNA